MIREKSILLTGGHAATMGISVIEQLKLRYPNLKISYIGAKYAISGSEVKTTEYKIYPKLNVNYYGITAGKLQTKFTLHTIPLILKIPIGFIQAFFLILKIKPSVILSFGGFASLPVVIWGAIFKIPIVLHEQTVVYGRASKIASFFADIIALAREDSLKYFQKKKCVITGNPLMGEVLKIKTKDMYSNRKVILINVGSRGSEFIGDEIVKILPELLTKYEIYHIAGERNYERYVKYKNNKYHLFPFVNPLEIAKLYEIADIVIARAGASTISEILHIKRPSLVIPLPRTFMNEQVENAKYAEHFGIAKVLLENEVNSKSLIDAIELLFKNWKEIVNEVKFKVSPDINGSKNVVDLVGKYI